MSRMFHLHISVRGVLNMGRAELRRMMKTVTKPGGGRFASIEDLRACFMDELARGRECLDISNGACTNFDPKTGCIGHEVSKPESAA